MDLYEELLNIVDAFYKEKLDYALCGGIAVAFHGYPRFTKDIDILIRPEDLEQVLEVVRNQTFLIEAGRMPFGEEGQNRREIYRISKIEGEEILTLDFILVSPILEDVWEGREIFEWKGREVQVVSPEGLLKMKRLSGRDQDILDLKKLGLMDYEEE